MKEIVCESDVYIAADGTMVWEATFTYEGVKHHANGVARTHGELDDAIRSHAEQIGGEKITNEILVARIHSENVRHEGD